MANNSSQQSGRKIQQALSAMKKDPNAGLTRVSPGMYRNARGELVGQGGAQLNQNVTRQIQQQRQFNSQNPQNRFDLNTFRNSRELTPQERQMHGIDPRDPNSYSIDQNGNVYGTLIGWNDNKVDSGRYGNAVEIFGNTNPPSSWIPTEDGIANTQNVMPINPPPMPERSRSHPNQYRLSPGVYGNQRQAFAQYQQQLDAYNQDLEAQYQAQQATAGEQTPEGGGPSGNWMSRRRHYETKNLHSAYPRNVLHPRRGLSNAGKSIRNIW